MCTFLWRKLKASSKPKNHRHPAQGLQSRAAGVPGSHRPPPASPATPRDPRVHGHEHPGRGEAAGSASPSPALGLAGLAPAGTLGSRQLAAGPRSRPSFGAPSGPPLAPTNPPGRCRQRCATGRASTAAFGRARGPPRPPWPPPARVRRAVPPPSRFTHRAQR